MDTIDSAAAAARLAAYCKEVDNETDLEIMGRDVSSLELRIRVLKECRSNLKGDKYGLELKVDDLRTTNHHLMGNIISLRGRYLKARDDLYNIELENSGLVCELDELKKTMMMCQCNHSICKSYRQHCLYGDDDEGTDTVDAEVK